MGKIKSFSELKELREQLTTNRNAAQSPDHTVILVGMATCGIAAGGKEALDALNDEIAKRNVQNVSVISTGCLGYCFAEPLVEVRSPGMAPIRYGYVDSVRAVEIVNRHVISGELLDNAIICLDFGSNEEVHPNE